MEKLRKMQARDRTLSEFQECTDFGTLYLIIKTYHDNENLYNVRKIEWINPKRKILRYADDFQFSVLWEPPAYALNIRGEVGDFFFHCIGERVSTSLLKRKNLEMVPRVLGFSLK